MFKKKIAAERDRGRGIYLRTFSSYGLFILSNYYLFSLVCLWVSLRLQWGVKEAANIPDGRRGEWRVGRAIFFFFKYSRRLQWDRKSVEGHFFGKYATV